MKDYRLAEQEMRFAEIVWINEPIRSGDLVILADEELNWKKSTTYTVLKKLCDRGILQNEDTIVTSLISKKDYFAHKSVKFVEDTFSGSLPAFLSAFSRKKKLTAEEVLSLRQLIDTYEEEE